MHFTFFVVTTTHETPYLFRHIWRLPILQNVNLSTIPSISRPNWKHQFSVDKGITRINENASLSPGNIESFSRNVNTRLSIHFSAARLHQASVNRGTMLHGNSFPRGKRIPSAEVACARARRDNVNVTRVRGNLSRILPKWRVMRESKERCRSCIWFFVWCITAKEQWSRIFL